MLDVKTTSNNRPREHENPPRPFPDTSLKVVALISGGKDSLFSILHCVANGHDVVALANLHPPLVAGEQSEDIDSFMYQTIGHSVIPLYEEALGLPLYRQEISGSAVNQDKSYGVAAVCGLVAVLPQKL